MRKYHMCSGGGVKDNRCVVCCQCVYISAIYMYCSQSFIDIMYRQYSTVHLLTVKMNYGFPPL